MTGRTAALLELGGDQRALVRLLAAAARLARDHDALGVLEAVGIATSPDAVVGDDEDRRRVHLAAGSGRPGPTPGRPRRAPVAGRPRTSSVPASPSTSRVPCGERRPGPGPRPRRPAGRSRSRRAARSRHAGGDEQERRRGRPAPGAGESPLRPRRSARERRAGVAARAPARRGLPLDDLHQARAQRGRRVLGGHRGGQHVDGGGEPAQALRAAVALGEVVGDHAGSRARRARRARRRRGRRRQRAPCSSAVAHDIPPSAVSGVIASASWARIFSRPSRIRPLTVPSGIPSISAISEWLKPPK